METIPPGIVAFKDPKTGFMWEAIPHGAEHYNEYVRISTEKGFIIHTISVDGKEWSVGNATTCGYIEKFEYRGKTWRASGAGGMIVSFDVPVSELESLETLPEDEEDDIYDAVRKYRDEHPELMTIPKDEKKEQLKQAIDLLERVHAHNVANYNRLYEEDMSHDLQTDIQTFLKKIHS